jgi:Uma2 family endonuclease
MTWQEVLSHPSLQDLPFKIELNDRGIIEMSPATNCHGILQGEILTMLNVLLPSGRGSVESSIQTTDGVRVADVAWATREFLQEHRQKTPFLTAPHICVEIISQSNSKKEIRQKIALFLEAGASEVWICSLNGQLLFYNHTGEIVQSNIAPNFPKEIEL